VGDSEEILYAENRKPQYVFEEGSLYCDGVLVQPWQLTPEEVEQWIPREFLNRYLPPGSMPCPFDKCPVEIKGKSEWTTHFRFKHSEFFKAWAKEMSDACNDYDELKAFVMERKDV